MSESEDSFYINRFGKYKMVYTINDMNQEEKQYKQLNVSILHFC